MTGAMSDSRCGDRIDVRGSRNSMPRLIDVDADFAWLLGLYVAEGSRRRNQVVFSNTDQEILDRVELVLARLGLPVYRARGAITCCSTIFSSFVSWLRLGDRAQESACLRSCSNGSGR